MIASLKNFFREDLGEIVAAYFDGEKIFIAHLTEKFETTEVDADGSESERIAEKISIVCRQKGWKTFAVGFCLQEGDTVTFQTEVGNVPEKEIPAMVKSWAAAQAGTEAAFSFARVDEELWMETLPRTKVEEFCAAFEKFGMNLRALSVMPADVLKKIHPFERTEFISEVIRDKKAPNFLSARRSLWDWKKFSLTAAAIFIGLMILGSAKLFVDYGAASAQLDAAKISVNEMSAELALKENLDADIAELQRLHKICAAQNVTQTKFNLLINLGKISGGGIRLTEISIDEKFLELEGKGSAPDVVKSYLSRVKNFVAQSARLESSKENDDGEIVFMIRATL